MGPHVEEWLGFGEGAVEDGEGVAGFDEVGAHGLAHDAGSDPAHGLGFSLGLMSSVSVVLAMECSE